MKYLFFLLCSLWFICLGHAQYLPPPSNLAVEYLRSPATAVITDATPEFSWVFPQSGLRQTAYRILVATSPFLLEEGRADLWDSGKIDEDQSVNVAFAGKTLQDNSTYWWLVKVWSTNGLESDYSWPQQFNTGNFDRSGLDYPGQSRWVELTADQWVSEDKQHATFHRFKPVSSMLSDEKKLFVDFGKSAIGILEFTATAEDDNVPLTVHLGERKNEDQTVHKQPGRSTIG